MAAIGDIEEPILKVNCGYQCNIMIFTACDLTLSFIRSNEYLFIDTGVKKMKWFLSSHEVPFQPRVTEGHEWLEMALSEK